MFVIKSCGWSSWCSSDTPDNTHTIPTSQTIAVIVNVNTTITTAQSSWSPEENHHFTPKSEHHHHSSQCTDWRGSIMLKVPPPPPPSLPKHTQQKSINVLVILIKGNDMKCPFPWRALASFHQSSSTEPNNGPTLFTKGPGPENMAIWWAC